MTSASTMNSGSPFDEDALRVKKGIDWNGIRRAFIAYCLDQDAVFVTVPSDESYDGQRLLRAEIKRRWTTPYVPRVRSGDDRPHS